jgi:hypothetical protein
MVRTSGVTGCGGWVRWLCVLATATVLAACDGGTPTETAGDGGPPLPPPTAIYEACGSHTNCEDSECLSFEQPRGSQCTVGCTNVDQCPALDENHFYRTLLCTEGACRAVECFSSNHGELVAEGLICFRDEVVPCGTLSPRPCACGCLIDQFCDSGDGVCLPKLDLFEDCSAHGDCASGYCSVARYGANRLCDRPPGTTCTGGADDCLICQAPGEGDEGYCLPRCGNCPTGYSCSPIQTNICYRDCTSGAQCEPWEYCYFHSPSDYSGHCHVMVGG